MCRKGRAKVKKKLTALVVSALMLVTLATVPLLAASATDGPLEEITFPIVEEPITVTLMMGRDTSSEDPYLYTKWFERYQDMTNIIIDIITVPSASWTEKRNLALVSGDYSDIFYQAFTPNDEIKYGSQGIFIPLNDLVEQYAPTFRAAMEENADIAKSITQADGNIYSLPYLGRSTADGYFGETFTEGPYNYMNTVWLENLGLEAPTTIDELYDVLVAFKEQDPNQNGLADEIPFFFYTSGESRGSMAELSLWFGYMHGMAEEDGQAYYGQAREEHRDYLKFLKQLYDEGLLYRDSLTLTVQQAQAIAQNSDVNVVGLFFEYGAFTITGTDNDKYQEYQSIPPVVADNGKQMTRGRIGITTGTFVITDKCEYPEEMMQWVDWQLTEEGGTLMHLGIEGEDFAVDPESGAYYRLMPEGYTDDSFKYNGPLVMYPKLWNITTDPFNSHVFANRYGVLNPYAVPPLPKIIYAEADAAQNASINADVTKYVNEFAVGVITGEIDVDAEWDNYQATLKAMGLDAWIESTQNALDTFNSK